MRVIFLNRYFYPDHSATSQMLSDLAFYLAGAGHEVCVVTSCQRYDDAAAGLPLRERVDGVEVHRVRTTRFGRDNLVGRAADNPLRREWGLEGKFIVCYSGNMGRAHEFDTILDAAERLASVADAIAFLFIGAARNAAWSKTKSATGG